MKKRTKNTQTQKQAKKIKLDQIEDQNTPSTTTSKQLCQIHQSPIEFLCQHPDCLKELCGHCILQHSHHIHHIISLTKIISDFNEISEPIQKNPKKSQMIIQDHLITMNNTMDNLENHLISIIKEHFSSIKDHLKSLTEDQIQFLNDISQDKSISIDHAILLYKKYKNYLQKKPLQKILLHTNSIPFMNQLSQLLQQNIVYEVEPYSLQSSEDNCPKQLHWFEWGKKKIVIYDIVLNETHWIELSINFKIPCFSRSITIPDGKIYLLGGEEPDYFSRREVYQYDPLKDQRNLEQKTSMIHKKFDFTVCYMTGFIYVLCGKNSNSDVTDSCERYDIEQDCWRSIANVNKKRYAASACAFRGKQIYLFGGRFECENDNIMIKEIEQYQVDTDIWTIIDLNIGSQLWNPVEVCGCVQVDEKHIMIFGGSDCRIRDQHSTFYLNIDDKKLEKQNELKKAQVFVAQPFVYGNYIYAIGNEYYMKHRSLQRYSIDRKEWEIIF